MLACGPSRRPRVHSRHCVRLGHASPCAIATAPSSGPAELCVAVPRGESVDRLSLTVRCTDLNEAIGLHLTILDRDDLRGALKPDSRGRTERGDLAALQKLIDATSASA